MSLLLALSAVFAAATLGYYLYLNYSGGATATYDAIATVSSAFWVLTGVYLILGGFVLAGMIVVALFVYVGATKGSQTKRRLRARIAD